MPTKEWKTVERVFVSNANMRFRIYFNDFDDWELYGDSASIPANDDTVVNNYLEWDKILAKYGLSISDARLDIAALIGDKIAKPVLAIERVYRNLWTRKPYLHWKKTSDKGLEEFVYYKYTSVETPP